MVDWPEAGYHSHRSRHRSKYRKMIEKAIKKLESKATPDGIIECIKNEDKTWEKMNKNAQEMLPAQVKLMIVNSPSRVNYGENNKPRGYKKDFDFLFLSSGGVVEFYEPSKHGEWTIMEDANGKPGIAKNRLLRSADSETIFDPETLKKLFHKHFRMSGSNYREIAARILLDATEFTDDGKQIKKNVEKLNFGKPPKPKGFGPAALEMCREPMGRNVGIVYNKAERSYSLALSQDTSEEQRNELKGICGEYIAKWHVNVMTEKDVE